MHKLTPFAFSRLGVALATLIGSGHVLADTQLITPTHVQLTIDVAAYKAKSPFQNISIGPLGQATWNESAGLLTLSVQSVETSANPGPAVVKLGAGNGFVMHTQWGDLSLTNIYFDAATNTIVGDVFSAGGYSHADNHNVTIWVAKNASGKLGSDPLSKVTTSTSARALQFDSQTLTDPQDISGTDGFQSYLDTVKAVTASAPAPAPHPRPHPRR